MNGVELIQQERRRQVAIEGFSTSYDMRYVEGELALAAICYAWPCSHELIVTGIVEKLWPWSASWFKCADRTRDLVKAGALIAAEIDRLLLLERRVA